MYHILCSIKLAASFILAAVLLLKGDLTSSSGDEKKDSYSDANSRFARTMQHYGISGLNESQKMTLLEEGQDTEDSGSSGSYGFFLKIFYLAMEIYIYACINSLFLDIVEESNVKGSPVPVNNQQPLMTSQSHQPQYNATLHPPQPGPYNTVPIPLFSPRRHNPQ